MQRIVVHGLLCLALAATARAADLDTLAEWMCGAFSSAAQAEADSAYFDISLEVVEIWPAREDGRWLYVEQAVASNREQPYRQRVYRVHEVEDGVFASDVFVLPEPLRFAGAWQDEAPLASLAPDSLTIRNGCTVFLTYGDHHFAGGTRGTGCASTLRGASYATSAVRIFENRVESWDRGFDEDGAQVWGAEAGPYLFDRH